MPQNRNKLECFSVQIWRVHLYENVHILSPILFINTWENVRCPG